MNTLSGYKTFIAMGMALIVALWQYFVEPLPAVDPELWNVVVPAVAIALRVVTKEPVKLANIAEVIYRLVRYKK
jgi:hypothetical protein